MLNFAISFIFLLYCRCAKYLDMLIDMDTSIDLLPDEEIISLAMKPVSSSHRSEAESQTPSFQSLLTEWNSVLARSLSGLDGFTEKSGADPSGQETEERRSSGVGSPSARSRQVLAVPLDVADNRKSSISSSRVAKKAHLLIFNNCASR